MLIMKKGWKIVLSILGGITVVAGIFWSAMAICAHYGLDHLYDTDVDKI